MQGENSKKKLAPFQRLERLRRLQELTWHQVGQKLGVSVPMLMLVKSGRRNFSEKVLARLEWAEVEAGLRPRSTVSEAARAVGKRQETRIQLVSENDIQKGYFEFRPEYRPGAKKPASPEVIRLDRPDSDGRARLGMAIAKSFDSEIVIFACLPDSYRREDFLGNLTPSSRSKLHDSAMALVFGTEWHATVARLAVESRIGDRSVIDRILGRE
jgi:transcriptional regulator with XRE-family HTH domain